MAALAELTQEAEAQLDQLLLHYAVKGYIEAIDNLIAAVEQARADVALAPDAGRPAPRPYPLIARGGHRWIKVARYWFAYRVDVFVMLRQAGLAPPRQNPEQERAELAHALLVLGLGLQPSPPPIAATALTPPPRGGNTADTR